MHVIVCGAGRVGHGIARRLAREGHDVVIVDEDPSKLDRISTDLDVRGVRGNGAHPDVLERAGGEIAQLVVAVTQFDEVNMVICQVAKTIFSADTTIARVRASVYRDQGWKNLFSNKAIPVDLMFSPEMSVAKSIIEQFKTRGAVMSAEFADGNVQLIGLDMDDDNPLIGTNLDQIAGLFPDLQARVVGIGRSGKIQAPRSNDALQRGDRAYIAVKEGQRARLNTILEREEPDTNLITLIGGGNIGLDVAQRLSNMPGVRLRLIEADEERANKAVQKLRKAVVIHGNGMNPSVLEEAGGARADLMIAATDDDRTNLLACGLGKRLGARQTLALINDPDLMPLRKQLDIDSVVDPRALTISEVLVKVRRGRIVRLRSLEDGLAEVVEGTILETSPMINKKLGYDDLPDGITAVAVYRDGQVLFPGKDVSAQVKDRVILLFEEGKVRDEEYFFRVSAEFF